MGRFQVLVFHLLFLGSAGRALIAILIVAILTAFLLAGCTKLLGFVPSRAL